MCIKIITPDNEVSYDMNQPLEPQILNAKQVVISYDPEDPSIGKFMNEIERCTLSGTSIDLNLKVQHNYHIGGAKLKQKAEKLSKDLDLNEIIKAMATSYAEADKKLEELANCLHRDDNVR
jgi:hypothetical protein